MNDPIPTKKSHNNDFDAELVLTFLARYQSLEKALVRAGLTRPGRTPGNARPDWDRFARRLDLEWKFDPDASPELEGAVSYLLGQPGVQELRWERLQASLPGEWSSPHSDMAWLAELILGIRNKVLYRINFGEEPWGDVVDVTAALLIVESWSCIDPQGGEFVGPSTAD